MYISGKIDEYRDKTDITQEELAAKIGLSRASIVNMEQGRQNVSLERLFDIAVVLKCNVTDLIPSSEWYIKNKNKKIKKIVTFEIIED